MSLKSIFIRELYGIPVVVLSRDEYCTNLFELLKNRTYRPEETLLKMGVENYVHPISHQVFVCYCEDLKGKFGKKIGELKVEE